jgi:branched-chain amino acid transport system substrate-binding protein
MFSLNRRVAVGTILLVALAAMRAPAIAADGIKVGIAQPLGGGNADYFTRQAVDPAILAIEEINAEGGLLGQKVQYVVEDNKGDPATSAAVVRKMIDVDHISVLMTSVSPAVLAALPIAEQNSVIVLSLAQHPKITASPWGFRISATGTNFGIAMANFAWDDLHAKTVAMLGENNDAIRLSQAALKRRFEQLGGRIVATETFAPTDQDLRAQLTKIRAVAPDVLSLQATGPRLHGLALKQAAEMGVKPSAIIANQTVTDPQLVAIAGAAASGVYYATIDVDKAWNEHSFRPRFGFDAEAEGALTYDGLHKYFDAVRSVGSADAAKIRDTLSTQPASKGASGTWGYGGTREPDIMPVIRRIP